MQLIVEIEEQYDLQLLIQLLERLKISYKPLITKKNGKKRPVKSGLENPLHTSTQKHFDIDEIERLFDKLHAMNAFADISDPVEWQRKLRNEWD